MKKTFVSAAQLEQIAAQYPTPFHIYDEQGIRENARRLNAAFSWNPGFREYFAVKATPTPLVQIAIPVGTVAVADGDHARQAKPVAQELDRLGHALADTDAVGQRADDLVRIRFFKLIVANVFHNEIMDRALLLRRWQAAQRTQ